jgi:hypothetical protein
MRSTRLAIIVLLSMPAVCHAGTGVSVSPDEQSAARSWAAAMFEGHAAASAAAPGLEVLRNWGRVQKNVRYGQPLAIAKKQYTRGLFCHAPSAIKVRLPGPGKTFEAVVGGDDALQWDVRDYPSGRSGLS